VKIFDAIFLAACLATLAFFGARGVGASWGWALGVSALVGCLSAFIAGLGTRR